MPEKLSFGDMEGEDLATTVLTCEGDITDPSFPFKLQLLVTKLQHLISHEEKPIKVIKVEPWNSVRVTFNIPLEAAQRLRQLAERGDQVLRELGILSVQIEGDQVITLTLAGQFNEPQEIVLRKTTEDQNEVASLTFNLPSSEPVPGPSSAEPAHKNISQFLGHIVGGAAATASASAAACSSTRVELPDFPVKSEPSVAFRSPNVIAPSNTEPIPFPSVPSHSPVPSSALLRLPASTAVKSQPTFGPFPFASMTHAMNTKHSGSIPQYQAVHKSSTSPRLPLTTATTILTTPTTVARSSAFTNPNIALSITRPQNASSPTLQKPSRPVSSPVFNNIVSRVAPPNSVVPVSRANVALSSPLLVNLLQSETSTLQGHNKLMPPPAIAANQAAKRKRKPRKPKDKTTEDGTTTTSSVGFSSLPSPPSHIGLRSPVGLDAIGNLGQPFNMPMSNIPLSPPTPQISSMHPVTKAQVPGSAMQAQTANIHPQAQGQPPVSLHSVQGQPPLSSSRLIQGPSAISAMRRQSLVHHTPVPNIHPQAQGQPQVHTGNLPLHTHIPVGSPQLARPSPNALPSYAMSVARGVTMNTSRMLFANRDSGLTTKPMEKSHRDISLIKSSYKPSASSRPCNSTPESNPFPSPPSSSDGKTKHLINPFTGQLESASDDEEEDESIGSLPPFPDFEVDNSENGQSERSLSDGGKENNLSSDTDSGISKSHTDISQSSSEGASADSARDQKKMEIVIRAETVSSASVTSSVPGEKLKLRLKIDPKTIRESKEVEIREKKLKEGSSATVIQKLDAGLTCVSGVKKNAAATGSTTAAPEPRVPPLHISLRGPNSAVVVSPRKEDAKTKHSLGKDRSPRSARTSDTCSSGVSGATRLFDSDKRVKNSGVRDCKKGKDDYWNQNVKNMSGGGIVEVTEKLNLSHSSNYETYLPHVTVPAGAMQRKPSLSVRDSCKSDVITLTSCATGESVSIHTAASSRSPLPFHLMVTPENENAVNPQPSQVGNSSVQVVTSLSERTSKNSVTSSRNHVQEPSDSFSAHCDRKKESLSVLASRKSSQFMQKGHLPQSLNMQTDSRNSVQKASRSNYPHPQTSANCVPITSTVPPVSSHSVCVVSAAQCFTKSVTPVVTSAADPGISSISDANTPFLKRKNVSKSLTDGISPLTSDRCQVSNQCNTNSSSARLDMSESAVSSNTVQNEKAFSNSHSDAFYTKDKVLIKEVQMNTTVNRDPTANNNCDISTNDVNCSSDGKITVENSVDSPVSVKPLFVEKDAEHKDSVFNNIIDRCKSPLASIVSVTKREIIQDVMNTSERGLRLIEIKKPPIAQIITVDSIPIQSRVIEVPSLPSSLSVPNSMVKSDLAIEVSSIPSLIPSHGGSFLPPRSALVLQECRSTSLINDSGHSVSEFSRPKVSNSCLDNYPNSRILSSELENERPGFNDSNTEPKIKAEEDSNEQGSSTNPSEESSMDSIDEERKRCMLVSEVRTSTPGPPNDVKSEESETSNCCERLSRNDNEKDISKNSHSTSAMPHVKSVPHQIDDPSQKQTSSSSRDVSFATVSKDSLAVDVSSSTENQLSTPTLPVLPPTTEKNSSKSDSACDDVTLQNNKLTALPEATLFDKSVNKPSETTSVVDPVPTQVLSVQSLPSERTATTSVPARKFEDSAIISHIVTETPHSTPSSQPLRCNPVCEPISVVCSTSNSVVSSLLSQGRFLPSEVGSGGRVKLIFKGSNPHSVLSSCNSPTSVVLPLNASKTVPIKLVTLPGGSAGLSVRSTSNPNVVEIIGQKPPSAHVSPASGSRQLSSPVRLVVSKVAPSGSCSNQSGTSGMRNRVVVKSVVVTGTASPIKLVSATTTSMCSMPTVTVTSSTSTLTLSEKRVASLSLCSSVPPTLQPNRKPNERSEETELEVASNLFNKNSKTNSKEHPSESNDSIHCHSPFQPVSSHPDITMISSSPEVSISSLSSSSSLCSVPSTNADDSTQSKLKSTDETSDSKPLPTLDDISLNDSKTETNFLENLLNENFPPTDKETNTKNELNSCDLSMQILDCANVGNTDCLSPKEEISGAKELIENSSKNVSPSPNLSTLSDVSSVEHCTNSPDLTLDDTCQIAREITVGSEVQISCEESEPCTDTKISVEIVPKCNTDNYDDLVIDQNFLLNAVQNDLCISPNSVIKSEDILEEEDIPDKVKVDKHHIRPFKEPKMEIKANRSGVNTCDGEQDELKGGEKCQLAATLVYSKPVKRKCSENAAELIKACMGVEDGPKRGLILKPKDEVTEKVEPVEKIEEDGGRMSLRVRRDDATKKCKGSYHSDCSSDEELALSELISKVRTRERPTRVRPCSRDTPTELVNCRPGRRRSGSNESQKSDEIKSRTRDCKRESKREETVKKMPERTKRGVLKTQGVQRNVHIKDNDVKQSVINIKDETNAKRKTRSTGNTETAVEVVPGKRRRYSKDGHR